MLDIEAYGAKSNTVPGYSTFDSTQAIKDAIANEGVALVPRGRYLVNDELALNAGETLAGVNPSVSELWWRSDLGAAKWGIRYAVADPWGAVLRNLTLSGPGWGSGVAPVIGTPPAAMGGVKMAAGGQVEWCRVQGFGSGLGIFANHEEVKNSRIAACGRGIYFGPNPPSGGDQSFENIQISDHTIAGIAVHDTSLIGGAHFTGIHFGNCPVGIYGEASTGANRGLVTGTCVFTDCAWEGYGNGMFVSHPSRTGCGFHATLIECAEGSGMVPGLALPASYGLDRAAPINAAYVNLDIRGGNWPSAHGTETMFKCRETVSKIRMSEALNSVNACVSTGKPFATGSPSVGMSDVSVAGTTCQVLMHQTPGVTTTPPLAVGELVQYLYLDRMSQFKAGGLPVGVVVTPTPLNACALVAVAGTVDVLTDTTSIGNRDYVKPDTARPGKVTKAASATDSAIGYARSAPAGGKVSVRLLGFQ